MRTNYNKNLLKTLIFFSLFFFILPLNSQKKDNNSSATSAKIAIDKYIKELKNEKDHYTKLAKALSDKEQMLKQWESEIETKSKELENERKKLNNEWKKLDEARKAKKLDRRIKTILETLDPQAAIDSIVHYYKTDKNMFYSIGLSILTMKKGVRTSILQGLSTSHKQIFIDLIDFLARQAGYQEKLKEFKKKKGGGGNG